MSLNTIELSDSAISELYHNNLVVTEGFRAAASAPATGRITRKLPPDPSAAQSVAPLSAPTPAAPPHSIAPAAIQSPQPYAPAATPLQPAATTIAPSKQQPATVTPSQSPQPAGYKFLGNNRRKITMLVNAPGSAFLPDDQLAVLTKMLEACKMNIGDVAIVNQAQAPVNIAALKQQLQPAFLLLFGLEPLQIQLPINFPVFKIQAYDQCTYLRSPSLEELVQPGDTGKLLKSKLWICLKTLFEI